jgi:endonuclease YncB( thermonuclease family)/methylphosphotriester-DNA--protein-cysteine methyltransferase
MKTFTKATSLFSLLVISALFCVAQQTPPRSQKPSAVTVSNSVRSVIEGKVTNVHDGDTVTVTDQDNKKTNIRLQGIDAPELKQAFGTAAQENLARMVLGKQVTIYWTKVDKYRRIVGTIMLDGRDVNIEQVKAGVAWHFKKYEDEQPAEDRRTYAAAEEAARAARLGLWSDAKSIAPGDWRQEARTKRWGPPPPEGTIIGNLKSKQYHRPDCAGYRDMAEANRVFFKTVGEAETAGYKRAGNCPAEIQSVAQKASVLAQTNGSSSAPGRKTGVSVQLATNKQEAIIGNKNSKVYHLPGCAGYTRVSEKNQVKFNTAEEAEQAGYKLAGNCAAKNSQPPAESQSQPSLPARSTTSASTSVATPESPVNSAALSSANQTMIIGNKNSKIYHLPGCAGYTKVSEQNLVKFTDAEEAEKAGFRLAKNCSASRAIERLR